MYKTILLRDPKAEGIPCRELLLSKLHLTNFLNFMTGEASLPC